jgi:hypothetical protein
MNRILSAACSVASPALCWYTVRFGLSLAARYADAHQYVADDGLGFARAWWMARVFLFPFLITLFLLIYSVFLFFVGIISWSDGRLARNLYNLLIWEFDRIGGNVSGEY